MSQLHTPDQEILKLLAFVSRAEASDLHLKVGLPPYVRIGGHLKPLDMPPLPDSTYITAMMVALMPPGREEEYQKYGGIDFAFLSESGDRFRVNAYRSDRQMHAALRRVNSVIPDFEKLHLPPVYQQTISRSFDGLILVTGVTGSGKSSTLAAMMDWINHHRSMHVITIEDPIEYRFASNKSIVSQREIGIDVPSYSHALRYVVRQDPDCILIGELRDKETILAAVQAAETGHLVMASMHCSDAEQSFSRILEFFPKEEHAFIRSSLANSLRAIMCQRLIPGAVEGERYPATEVLLNNPIVRERILNEQDEDIPAILNVCKDEGMRDFTHSLCELVQGGKISMETGMDYAPHRESLASLLKGIDTAADGLVSRV
ncbi:MULTISPECIES: type IV pilus twitching motility protein PilT [Crateriforma]|uniref:Twitching mobility protein n=1 Tax=Crateriforma conspicua TaxID=2527996 RepID=A0A5C5Y4H9_9PLAN|nr:MULTISPECIES: PilT/PilU family type 4a pilus ATPase [Crateriforma]QDV64677.1 Twitching mobility protein [Crateriforma conspicua]TWT70074.1 Twitching mobility protein [Crateriforma conspicua]TWU65959.1 Twitching mobility protein [Crateriforma conspicua]